MGWEYRGTWTPRKMVGFYVGIFVVVAISVLIPRSDRSFTVKSWTAGGVFITWFFGQILTYRHLNRCGSSQDK